MARSPKDVHDNDDGAQFLAAIQANPDDDGPRLVYADWLTEGRDPRGEFIVIQCAIASADVAQGARMADGEDRLVTKHRARWLRDLGIGGAQCTFRRGLVESVSLEAPRFLAVATRLFAGSALRDLTVTSVPPSDLPLWRRIPELTRLRSLTLLMQQVVSFREGISGADLAAIESLANLTALALPGNGLTTSSLAKLGGAFPKLTRLDVSGNRLADLRDALPSFMSPLEELDLSGNDALNDLDVAAFVNTPPARTLKALRLFVTGVGDAGAATLAGEGFPHLRELDFGGTKVTSKGVRALAISPHRRDLRVLRLVACPLGYPADGIDALCKASFAPGLERLDLGNTRLADTDVKQLADSPLMSSLRELRLHSNSLGWSAAASLARSPNTGALEELHLDDNQIDDDGAMALARAPYLGSLRGLHLGKNKIGKPALRALRARFAEVWE